VSRVEAVFAAALPAPQADLVQGFSFVGRQYRLDVGDDDFYIDLLFYHLRLRSVLPTVEEIEMELSGRPRRAGKVGRKKR
jgi:hypothetical protein